MAKTLNDVVLIPFCLHQIFRRIRESEDDDAHGKQIDAVLSQITSHCNFPQVPKTERIIHTLLG